MSVGNLSEVAMGPATAFGRLGLTAFLVGLFASTIGAAVEVTLSNGYSMAQFFGWRWGKILRPLDAPRFQLIMLASLALALAATLTTIDPIRVTELSVVASAIALPLTYFPVLVVANDEEYMGKQVNGRVLNAAGSVYLVIILLASVAAIPLMIVTKMGA
jgi:manganese transport protein